jgi:hypothetical protein
MEKQDAWPADHPDGRCHAPGGYADLAAIDARYVEKTLGKPSL